MWTPLRAERNDRAKKSGMVSTTTNVSAKNAIGCQSGFGVVSATPRRTNRRGRRRFSSDGRDQRPDPDEQESNTGVPTTVPPEATKLSP